MEEGLCLCVHVCVWSLCVAVCVCILCVAVCVCVLCVLCMCVHVRVWSSHEALRLRTKGFRVRRLSQGPRSPRSTMLYKIVYWSLKH